MWLQLFLLKLTWVCLCVAEAQLGNLYGPGNNAPQQVINNDATASWTPDTSSLAKIRDINVQCSKNGIAVNVTFTSPFSGVIFSKGFFSNPNCMHVAPSTGLMSVYFTIQLGTCGLQSPEETSGQPTPGGSSMENTIVIQYDPRVQEVWDQARKIKCTWYDYYEKAVTFRPFRVNMLNAITANFLGDNLQCWMQIQVGKGPWASEVSGIVKIGQTMTMVLGIKDEENKFDMMVRNCVAHDGRRLPIQLVDDRGCVVRKKIMSKFQKVQNFGPSATVVSYAYFQAFKFPDSVNVHFQCVIQVCRFSCPEAVCDDDDQPVYGPGRRRRRRDATDIDDELEVAKNETITVPTTRIVQVMDPNDLSNASRRVMKSSSFSAAVDTADETLCITMPSAAGITLTLICVTLFTSVVHSVISCNRLNRPKKAKT